jgi:hypothetical protein
MLRDSEKAFHCFIVGSEGLERDWERPCKRGASMRVMGFARVYFGKARRLALAKMIQIL